LNAGQCRVKSIPRKAVTKDNFFKFLHSKDVKPTIAWEALSILTVLNYKFCLQ